MIFCLKLRTLRRRNLFVYIDAFCLFGHAAQAVKAAKAANIIHAANVAIEFQSFRSFHGFSVQGCFSLRTRVVIWIVWVIIIVVKKNNSSKSNLHLCISTAIYIVKYIEKSWILFHESPEEDAVYCISTLNTGYTIGHVRCMCRSNPLHSTLITGYITGLECVKYVPKQSIA